MKRRLWLFAAGMLFAVMAFGVVGPVRTATAEEPETAGEVDGEYFFVEDAGMPRWLRYSIVYCAAVRMDIDIDTVKFELRQGSSLKEIGLRVGTRPEALENGILRCEHNLLERLVAVGEFDPPGARRLMTFLRLHIARIINYSWDG